MAPAGPVAVRAGWKPAVQVNAGACGGPGQLEAGGPGEPPGSVAVRAGWKPAVQVNAGAGDGSGRLEAGDPRALDAEAVAGLAGWKRVSY